MKKSIRKKIDIKKIENRILITIILITITLIKIINNLDQSFLIVRIQKQKQRKSQMPKSPRRPCRKPGCVNLALPGKIYCEEHNRDNWIMKHDKTAYQRGYTDKWQMASKAYLQAHPLCTECMKRGRYVDATVVDHIIPHRGDARLFWDRSNWQSLCKSCHDEKTGKEDRFITYAYPGRKNK